MKIFVGYGYNERDKWIKDFVFPIIQAFNDEVITGEELQGEQITDAVRQKIRQSDALFGFVTRRGEPIMDGKWLTHRWVTDEIAVALADNKPVVEVREEGVDDQGGIIGDRQRIIYRENERDKCLVELVKSIGKWHRGSTIRLKLLPEEYVRELFPLHRKQDLKCSYKLLLDGEESDSKPMIIRPITGGLFAEAKDVPAKALIQIHIEYQGKMWYSSFESTDSLGIYLRRD
jgi:hypothetical protein